MTVTIENTLENKGFLDFIQEWSDKIPTIYFLDVCTISNIKKQLSDKDKSYLSPNVNFLEKIDLPHNGLSYFPSLMERVSDQKNIPTIEQLKEEANRDVKAIDEYFNNAKLFEPIEFIYKCIEELCGNHIEILGQLYHSYLNKINNMGVADTKSRKERLKFAKQIFNEANELKISSSHPVVISSIACVYGCISAKKVMKFKKKQSEFNSSNALGDIMLLQRVGELTQDIEEQARTSNAKYFRAELITDDRYLRQFYDYFFVKNVSRSELKEVTVKEFKITLTPESVFPDLYAESGEFKDLESKDECLALYHLLGAEL